ncbi:MAG: hypothetical protein RLZZ70_699 [Candidatus Parcubacteria bacterium]|jgi:hypothetical protein
MVLTHITSARIMQARSDEILSLKTLYEFVAT